MSTRKPILLYLLLLPFLLQFNPQPKSITEKFFKEKNDLPSVTPALKKKKGFTNYEELERFLSGLKTNFPDLVRIAYIGKTKKGKPIPIVYLGKKSKAEKVRIWMQGGLHGDEPASTESLLYFLYELLHNKELASLLDEAEFAVVPMANIDGYLKQKRNNAQNLDLNRDQTKLMAVESPILKKAFTDFKPHVSLDFHEYRPFRRDYVKMGAFGVTSSYDVMFLYSGNLNVPKKLRDFTQEAFVEPTRLLLNRENLTHHDYFTTDDHLGETHFSRGSFSARSSATNCALLHSVSALIEVRGVGLGRTSFRRRIYTGYLVARSFSEQAIAKKEALFTLLEDRSYLNDDIVVQSKRAVYKGPLQFIDLEKVEKVSMEVTFRDAWLSEPVFTRTRPAAYAIEAEQEALIQKIKAFKLEHRILEQDETIEMEAFYVNECRKLPEKYEKMTLQDVKTTIKPGTFNLKKGSCIIPTDQIYGNILTELFEPEAPNSFVHFGVITVKQNQNLPFYRIPKQP